MKISSILFLADLANKLASFDSTFFKVENFIYGCALGRILECIFKNFQKFLKTHFQSPPARTFWKFAFLNLWPTQYQEFGHFRPSRKVEISQKFQFLKISKIFMKIFMKFYEKFDL